MFQGEHISRRGNFSFYILGGKELASTEKKNYFVVPSFKAFKVLHLTKCVKRYSTELNPLSHDIYLRVIRI